MGEEQERLARLLGCAERAPLGGEDQGLLLHGLAQWGPKHEVRGAVVGANCVTGAPQSLARALLLLLGVVQQNGQPL